MPTLFTRIIDKQLPAAFVWEDDRCVAFMAKDSCHPGHLLVVPRAEVDHWLDAPGDLMAHLLEVSRTIGEAQQRAYPSNKVALMVIGLEVPHLHLHLIPIDEMGDVSFANARRDVPLEELQASADRIKAELDR
jgi:diadenosine tetraphosphate (Ap4A) HIT family hydrolase